MRQTTSKAKKAVTKTKAVKPESPSETAVFKNAVADTKLADAVGEKIYAVYEKVRASYEESEANLAVAKVIHATNKAALAAAVKSVLDTHVTDDVTLAIYKNVDRQGALPDKDDIYEVAGYATDANGYPFLDPLGNKIKTDDMLRKIEQQDWDA